MKQRLPTEPFRIQREKDGTEFVLVDPVTNAFWDRQQAYCHLVLCSSSVEGLPKTGFLLAAKNPFGRLINRQFHTVSTEPTHPIWFGEQLALRIRVLGEVDGDDYKSGCTVQFVSGILSGGDFANWRGVNGLWAMAVWEKTGFDPQKLEPRRHYEKVVRQDGQFYEIEDLTKELSSRQKLLLTINLLSNYWEHFDIPYGARVFHLIRLGVAFKLDPKNLWNYSAEAGCISPPKSIFLKEWEQARKAALRYYRKHPDEFQDLQFGPKMEVRCWLPGEKAKKPHEGKSMVKKKGS